MTASERLAQLVRIPTVSSDNPSDEDSAAFTAFPEQLAELYPDAHEAMDRELIGDRAIVYRWEGSDSSLEPVLGLAHYDVVPPGNPESWAHPPFSGAIIDGRIHGRGSLDDKGMLAAWMEGADRLAGAGFRPKRTFYLAFGGDEETTGFRGAGRIAESFAEKGLRFAFILDEGGAVAADQLSAFTDRPVALVGIAEKGYLTLRVSARGLSGHASSPPKHSAIGRLGAALAALEAKPAAPRLTGATSDMLRTIGKAGKGARAFLLRHPGIFGIIIKKNLAINLSTAPLVRTTLAPTVIRGGERENVLPDLAEAMVNIRILPGDTVNSCITQVEGIIASAVNGGVAVKPVAGSVFEPVPASGDSGPWWNLLGELAARHFPGVITTPYLMTGTTDSRWYRELSDAIYRIIPMRLSGEETERVHAANESVSCESWETSVNFMEDLLKNALGSPGDRILDNA